MIQFNITPTAGLSNTSFYQVSFITSCSHTSWLQTTQKTCWVILREAIMYFHSHHCTCCLLSFFFSPLNSFCPALALALRAAFHSTCGPVPGISPQEEQGCSHSSGKDLQFMFTVLDFIFTCVIPKCFQIKFDSVFGSVHTLSNMLFF